MTEESSLRVNRKYNSRTETFASYVEGFYSSYVTARPSKLAAIKLVFHGSDAQIRTLLSTEGAPMAAYVLENELIEHALFNNADEPTKKLITDDRKKALRRNTLRGMADDGHKRRTGGGA